VVKSGEPKQTQRDGPLVSEGNAQYGCTNGCPAFQLNKPIAFLREQDLHENAAFQHKNWITFRDF